MNHPNPIMQQALAPFAPPVESDELAAYRGLLRDFDWQFEFSDDASVRRHALDNLAELRRMQTALDPDGSIWRAVAPGGHGEPQPKVSA
jgi:hypothetical protein